jgi:L,D-peptidoglycan transpeptidase YkuD (ErfK/YbiS/YcfS/YnhG family)
VRTFRRAFIAVFDLRASATALVLALLFVFAPASAGAAPGGFDPSSLPGIGGSSQVIVVTATNARTSFARVSAYEKRANGTWSTVIDATPARLGYSGSIKASARRQGTGKTPIGTFPIVTTFGRLADPGTQMPYVRFDRNDAWTYNPRSPSTYNLFQTANRSWRSFGSYVEWLWRYGSQYNYVAVLDYNLPKGAVRTGADGIRRAENPANTSKGGGIFLHVTNGKPTAGCIAIPQAQMAKVMRWIDPAKQPVVVVTVD